MPPRVNRVDALGTRRSDRNVLAQRNYAQMDDPWRRRSRSASPSPANRERDPLCLLEVPPGRTTRAKNPAEPEKE